MYWPFHQSSKCMNAGQFGYNVPLKNIHHLSYDNNSLYLAALSKNDKTHEIQLKRTLLNLALKIDVATLEDQ